MQVGYYLLAFAVLVSLIFSMLLVLWCIRQRESTAAALQAQLDVIAKISEHAAITRRDQLELMQLIAQRWDEEDLKLVAAHPKKPAGEESPLAAQVPAQS